MISRILVGFLLLIGAQARAATVKGTIILNEVGGRPIANVQIIDSAHTGGPWASGSDGGFTLDYPGRIPGQRVKIVVNKEGYVVVNDVQLDLALPADPDANPLQIIISKEADREEMARSFYRLKSNQAIEAVYQQKLKVLEEEHLADAAALTKLQQERNQARVAAEKASDQLAKTNRARTPKSTCKPNGCFWRERSRRPSSCSVPTMKNAVNRWRKRSRLSRNKAVHRQRRPGVATQGAIAHCPV
jgi:hypothetical protein